MSAAELSAYAGNRVRLTYPNGFQKVGLLTAHRLRGGEVLDLRIDGFGGFQLDKIVRAEVMRDVRYSEVWSA